MLAPRFGWDPAKARENLRKQGVAFEEAQTVFDDEQAVCLTIRTTRRMNNGSYCSG
jgi:uncharacterized DUF497 family protein